MTATIRYPSTPITPHGSYNLLRDRIPMVALMAYDESVNFDLMGALAIPDRSVAPERVEILDLKGLIGPWQTIDQKGATEDGITFIDALHDPIEVEMVVNIHGRNPAMKRRVERTLVGSLSPKLTSELSWFTHELGRWHAPVRWFKTAADSMQPTKVNGQYSLRLRADSGFWQSYPDVASFRFTYEGAVDDFDFTDTEDMGSGWTLAYSGSGDGHVSVDGDEVVWVEGDNDQDQTVVARKVGFTSETNNQVVEIELGSFGQFHLLDTAYNDIWARMKNTGTPGTDGVRLRFGFGEIELAAFIGGSKHVLRRRPLVIPPGRREKFTLVAGFEGNADRYAVLRNGTPAMRPVSTGALTGSSYRSAGMGMRAGFGTFSQASPARVRRWSAGDNNTVTQHTFLERRNAGDQDRWDRYTCFGPGTFYIANGPGSTDMVKFGPLLDNQVAQIRSDPRKRGVVDMTSTPPTPQELEPWLSAVQEFVQFATGNNVPPLLQEIASRFGVRAPQGPLFSLLDGRFSEPIPAKSPGRPIESKFVKVQIEGGNANSQIIATGTPLRRLPY